MSLFIGVLSISEIPITSVRLSVCFQLLVGDGNEARRILWDSSASWAKTYLPRFMRPAFGWQLRQFQIVKHQEIPRLSDCQQVKEHFLVDSSNKTFIITCMEDKNKTIAARVKELRRTKGISQTALARELNITVTAYNRIENDKTQITVHMLFSIAAALSVSVHTLLDLPVDNTGNHKTDTIMISAGKERVFLSISTEELRKYLSAKR